MAITILGICIFFMLGHALRVLFEKKKVPDLLFLILIGYLLGPVFGVLKLEDFGKVGSVLATIALIVILYEGGLGLKTRELLSSSLPALGLALITFVLVGVATAGLVLLLTKQTLFTAILMGVGIGSTSSAIVIPLVQVLNISNDAKTILSLESALTDVLVIVVFLILLESANRTGFNTADVMVGIGPNTVKAVLLGLFFGFIWAFLRKRFKEVTDVAFAGEAWALFTYSLIELMGLNGAMGVLALGFMLSNMGLLPEWAKNLCNPEAVDSADMALLTEVTLLLRTFFFLYLGMLIQLSNVKILALALLLTVVVFAIRFIATRIVFRPKRYSRFDAMMVTAMGPRGLACAVIAMIPVQRNLVGGQFIQDTVFAVIPFTILVTSCLVFLLENPRTQERFHKFFLMYPERSTPPSSTPLAPESIPPGQ